MLHAVYPNKPLIKDLSIIYVPFFKRLKKRGNSQPSASPDQLSLVDDKKISEKISKKKKKKKKTSIFPFRLG